MNIKSPKKIIFLNPSIQKSPMPTGGLQGPAEGTTKEGRRVYIVDPSTDSAEDTGLTVEDLKEFATNVEKLFLTTPEKKAIIQNFFQGIHPAIFKNERDEKSFCLWLAETENLDIASTAAGNPIVGTYHKYSEQELIAAVKTLIKSGCPAELLINFLKKENFPGSEARQFLVDVAQNEVLQAFNSIKFPSAKLLTHFLQHPEAQLILWAIIKNADTLERFKSLAQTHPELLENILQNENAHKIINIFTSDADTLEHFKILAQAYPKLLKNILQNENAHLVLKAIIKDADAYERFKNLVQAYPQLLENNILKHQNAGEVLALFMDDDYILDNFKNLAQAYPELLKNNILKHQNAPAVLRTLIENGARLQLFKALAHDHPELLKNNILKHQNAQDVLRAIMQSDAALRNFQNLAEGYSGLLENNILEHQDAEGVLSKLLHHPAILEKLSPPKLSLVLNHKNANAILLAFTQQPKSLDLINQLNENFFKAIIELDKLQYLMPLFVENPALMKDHQSIQFLSQLHKQTPPDFKAIAQLLATVPEYIDIFCGLFGVNRKEQMKAVLHAYMLYLKETEDTLLSTINKDLYKDREALVEHFKQGLENCKPEERYCYQKLLTQAEVWLAMQGIEKLKHVSFEQVTHFLIDRVFHVGGEERKQYRDYVFENEPGTILGMLKGFAFALSANNDNLTDFKKLHEICCTGVYLLDTQPSSIESGHPISMTTPGRFRRVMGYLDSTRFDKSQEGLDYLVHRSRNRSNNELSKLSTFYLAGDPKLDNMSKKSPPKLIFEPNIQNTEKLVKHIFEIYKKALEKNLPPHERLLLELSLARELETNHVYSDGNNRVILISLYARLARLEGLPMVLYPEPNMFDFNGWEKLVFRTLEAMECFAQMTDPQKDEEIKFTHKNDALERKIEDFSSTHKTIRQLKEKLLSNWQEVKEKYNHLFETIDN